MSYAKYGEDNYEMNTERWGNMGREVPSYTSPYNWSRGYTYEIPNYLRETKEQPVRFSQKNIW